MLQIVSKREFFIKRPISQKHTCFLNVCIHLIIVVHSNVGTREHLMKSIKSLPSRFSECVLGVSDRLSTAVRSCFRRQTSKVFIVGLDASGKNVALCENKIDVLTFCFDELISGKFTISEFLFIIKFSRTILLSVRLTLRY